MQFISVAYAQSTALPNVKVVSKRDPTKSWECLAPVANVDSTRPEMGACMPEALCDKATQKSKWTNMFG